MGAFEILFLVISTIAFCFLAGANVILARLIFRAMRAPGGFEDKRISLKKLTKQYKNNEIEDGWLKKQMKWFLWRRRGFYIFLGLTLFLFLAFAILAATLE